MSLRATFDRRVFGEVTTSRLARANAGLEDERFDGLKLHSEHASNGGLGERAALGDSPQFPEAEGLEDCRDTFGFVGAENVTIDYTRAPLPIQRLNEVFLDNGRHGLDGPIIAVLLCPLLSRGLNQGASSRISVSGDPEF